MPDLVQFVDQISGSPTVRLDLNDDAKWNLQYDGTDFSPPGLKQAWASTLLADGETLTAAAYENRRIRLRLDLTTATLDDAFAEVQKLHRELNRPTNLLKWQPQGATAPEFFRTMRSLSNRVTEYPGAGLLRTIDVEIVAAPFAYGLKETLPAVTVYADPAEGTTLNANPFFETEGASAGGSNPGFENGATVWTATSGTIVASQDFVRVNSWAGKLTASGGANPRAMMSQSATIVTAGEQYTVSGWLYAPSALPSTVAITVQWYTAGGAFVAQDPVTVTLTPGVWTYLEGSFTAPPLAERAARQFSMNATPAVGVLLYGDDIQIRVAKPADWTGTDGTIVRSTVQAHEGVASMLLTPDGVGSGPRAELAQLVPVTAGETYRVSAWVRCAVARAVEVQITWFTAVGVFIASSSNALAGGSVAANTWTFASDAFVAPAGAGQASIRVRMTGTPPSSNLLWIDEARLRRAGGVGGCCVDVTGIKGDVETPLYLGVEGAGLVTSTPDSSRMSAIAVRRRGTPSAAPFALQAESMSTLGTDTTVQANSAVMSGAGSNWTRTTFAGIATMQGRLSITSWPAAGSVDVRGSYRVFMRYRSSTASPGTMQARLLWGTGNSYNTNDTVDLIKAYGGAGGPYLLYADLGLVQFPQGYDPIADGPAGEDLPVQGMSFEVQAARTSGAANLDIDVLLFVPADDRLLLVTWPASPTLPIDLVLDSQRGQVYTKTTAGLLGRSGAQLAGGPPMVSPAVANRVYFVRDVGATSSTGSGAVGDVVTASTTVTPYYWPLFLYARPVAS